MRPTAEIQEAFTVSGYVVLEGALAEAELEAVLEALGQLPLAANRRGGVRGVLSKSPALRGFSEAGLPAQAAKALLGENAHPVKATVFDKTPTGNWKVPWHQDLTVAVEQRSEVPGFGPWSLKDGVPHVQPPAEILERLAAVRVHLDETGPSNGALRVIPGSHRYGKLSESDIERLRAETGEVVCPVARGGIMLMAPLLLHASSSSLEPGHRRVLHIEYTASLLPEKLSWPKY